MGAPPIQQQPPMQQPVGGPPPIEGDAGLKFAQNSTPEQLMTVMDWVNEVKVKQKAMLLDVAAGGQCVPATYAVKDVNGKNLLYGVEESHPCTRCCCGPGRKMRLDMIPAAAVEDASGDSKFSFKEIMNEGKACFSYGGAKPEQPVAFTIERSMEGSLFPCCRCNGAILNCCLEKVEVKMGPAPPRDSDAEDTRPVLSSVTQPMCGGGCTPTYNVRNGTNEIVITEKGAGGVCKSCCPGFCMCACQDNVFELFSGLGAGDKDKVEPVGHITRVNPKDMAGYCRQALTSADSYDVKFPAAPKEDKAAMLAAMLLTDLQFFDDGGDVGCDTSNGECKTIIKLFILNCYGFSCPVNCVLDWKQMAQNAQ